jgi:hypothetical protein
MQVVRAKVKQKMRGGRAKKCKTAEQNLNKICEVVGQKGARGPSKKMQVGRAEVKQKCKMAEPKREI